MVGALIPIGVLAPLMGKGGTLEVVAWIVVIPVLIFMFWANLAVQVKLA